MSSYIADDVKALLGLKKGDANRLNQIRKHCESNKVVSIADRKYVERLASQYLYKKEAQKSTPQYFPSTNSIESITNDKDESQGDSNKTKVQESQSSEKKPIIITKSSKNDRFLANYALNTHRKIITIGASAIVLAIIVIATVSIGGNNISVIDQLNEQETTGELSTPFVTLTTDESSYGKADIISISGESNPPIDDVVRVSVKNVDGILIWAENVSVKNNGDFSTLLIAGGEGWEKKGKYTLIAEYDGLQTQISFNFIG